MKNCPRTQWSSVSDTPWLCLWRFILTNLPGSYKAEAYDSQTNSFQVTPDLAIQITVDETFDNDHRVVSQTSTSSENPSKFTFSAADSGLHRLCFTPSGPRAVAIGGWFSGSWPEMGGVKLSLDLAIGATSKIESDDKGKIEGIVGKVKELNGRLMDIRREQVFQRVRSEAPWQLLRLVPVLLTRSRNERRNSETRAKPPMPELFGGRSFSWEYSASRAPGNFLIYEHFSSSKSLHRQPLT
jgi:emp24/gp25L/p24 family/GOLD